MIRIVLSLLIFVMQTPAPPQLQFVKIEPGTFQMGCSSGDTMCDPDENPSHPVRLTKAFEIGKFEITQAQWIAVMGEPNRSRFKGDDLPVENVSWLDVQQFLDGMNARKDGYQYRLPTEAEWEYAARAGTKSPNTGPVGDVAWYNGNSEGHSHPVGQKKPNAWGLYDIRGNVNEWVQDWYDPRYYSKSPMADPRGPESEVAEGGRVVRSGSFHDDGPWLTRVSLRQHFPEDYKHFDLGFRVVREKR